MAVGKVKSFGTLNVSLLFCLTYMFISWNLCIYITVVAQTDLGKIPERSASPTCTLTGHITTPATPLSARPLVPHMHACVRACMGESSPRPPHIQRPTRTFWAHMPRFITATRLAGTGVPTGEETPPSCPTAAGEGAQGEGLQLPTPAPSPTGRQGTNVVHRAHLKAGEMHHYPPCNK